MTVTEAAGLLEVGLPATQVQIRKAYHRIARQSHPDLHPGNPEAHGRMVAANRALEVLLRAVSSIGVRVPRKKPRQRSTSVPKAASDNHQVVWSGPPKAPSAFFEGRGFLIRPTDGRVTFRVLKAGRHLFTLERHRDDPELLVCRNERGEFAAIDGVTFWLDDGTSIVPYIDGRI
jgi:hypothetical protein